MAPIYLVLSRPSATPGTGTSRFWGTPDWPEGRAYPTYTDEAGHEHPYTFVCQINLADIAPYDPEGLLPHTGLLSFFAKIAPYLGHFEAPGCIGGTLGNPEDVKVIYFASCQGLTATAPQRFPGQGIPEVPAPQPIGFARTLPYLADEHCLLAPPSHRPWETWDPPCEEWDILLQVDSFEGADFNLRFMDCGVLEFLISPTDLKQRRFDRIRPIVLSS